LGAGAGAVHQPPLYRSVALSRCRAVDLSLYRDMYKPKKCAAEQRSFENRRVLVHISKMCRVAWRFFGLSRSPGAITQTAAA